MNHNRLRAYIQLLIVSVIWGIAGSVIKFTQAGISTLPFLTYRFGVSAIFGVISIALVRKGFPKGFGANIELFIYGLLVSVVSLGLLFLGLEKTTVVESELISATAPLFASALGVYMLAEHVTRKEKTGMAIAFLGTVFIVLEPLITNGHRQINLIGNLLVAAYVAVNAIASIMAKKLLRAGADGLVMTNVGFIVGYIAIAGLSYFQTGQIFPVQEVMNLEFKYHLGVLFMALVSGTLAYTLYNFAQKTIEVGEVAVFSYLLPVFGIPTAMLWLGEKVNIYQILGAVVITLGVFIAEVRKSKPTRR